MASWLHALALPNCSGGIATRAEDVPCHELKYKVTTSLEFISTIPAAESTNRCSPRPFDGGLKRVGYSKCQPRTDEYTMCITL
jgi:hypothetical protein